MKKSNHHPPSLQTSHCSFPFTWLKSYPASTNLGTQKDKGGAWRERKKRLKILASIAWELLSAPRPSRPVEAGGLQSGMLCEALLPGDQEMGGALARPHHEQAPDFGNDFGSRGDGRGRRTQFQKRSSMHKMAGEKIIIPA